jgi:hypothetical protein
MANVPQRFRFSEPEMKQKTRDNLIYVTVGLGIVALIVANFFYADSHGQKMWWPSKFASRVVYTTALLAYFVARETRKAKSTLAHASYAISIRSSFLTIRVTCHTHPRRASVACRTNPPSADRWQ